MTIADISNVKNKGKLNKMNITAHFLKKNVKMIFKSFEISKVIWGEKL